MNSSSDVEVLKEVERLEELKANHIEAAKANEDLGDLATSRYWRKLASNIEAEIKFVKQSWFGRG